MESEGEVTEVTEAASAVPTTQPTTSRNRKEAPLWRHISGEDTAKPHQSG